MTETRESVAARAAIAHSWTLDAQLRDVDTTDSLTMLEGRAVPYDQVADIGMFLESFLPGSLGKSARESAAALPLMLVHGQDGYSLPIGSASEWDERADGLYGTWRIADDPDAQRAARLVRDGHLNHLSIRFQPNNGRTDMIWEDQLPADLRHHNKPWFIRKEARLLEVSLTPTPAYAGATVGSIRDARRDPGKRPALDEWRERLEKLKAGR